MLWSLFVVSAVFTFFGSVSTINGNGHVIPNTVTIAAGFGGMALAVLINAHVLY